MWAMLVHHLECDCSEISVWRAGPMQLGDVSWHHGWTLHAAGAQPADAAPRLALSITLFEDGTRILPKRILQGRVHSEDAESYADWLPQLKDEADARHALLPLVYDAGASKRRIQ